MGQENLSNATGDKSPPAQVRAVASLSGQAGCAKHRAQGFVKPPPNGRPGAPRPACEGPGAGDQSPRPRRLRRSPATSRGPPPSRCFLPPRFSLLFRFHPRSLSEEEPPEHTEAFADPGTGRAGPPRCGGREALPRGYVLRSCSPRARPPRAPGRCRFGIPPQPARGPTGCRGHRAPPPQPRVCPGMQLRTGGACLLPPLPAQPPSPRRCWSWKGTVARSGWSPPAPLRQPEAPPAPAMPAPARPPH